MRTVLAHGCFDLLHLGHIRHLKEAAALGDRLVVSVTADQFVRKGVNRPRFTTAERVEALRALSFVDETVVSDAPDAVEVIRKIRPAVYVKGIDYDGSHDATLQRELDALHTCGGTLHITSTQKWSSSRLINTEQFSDDVLAYLDHARKNDFLHRIKEAADKADDLKILFVGETIIDEYVFVQALGKASKEFMLATVETGRECFVGGVAAAAKHGDWPHRGIFTLQQTMLKTRFVDADFNRKLFDVYSTRKLDLSDDAREQFQRGASSLTRDCDVVIVNDFGHGLIGIREREILEKSKFLAVNAQTNAGNYGFNPVTKYTKADFICVDDPEARLAVGNDDDRMEIVLGALSALIRCNKFLITHGRHGSFWYDKGRTGTAPAFTSRGIDTMGAGDAVMAVTAPLIVAGLDVEAAALVGNVVGAIKVSILGHRRHVGGKEWRETIDSLLK